MCYLLLLGGNLVDCFHGAGTLLYQGSLWEAFALM